MKPEKIRQAIYIT